MKGFKQSLSESKKSLNCENVLLERRSLNYENALQECNIFFLSNTPKKLINIDGWELDEYEWNENSIIMYANSRLRGKDDLLGISIYATPMFVGEDIIAAFAFYEGNDTEIEIPGTRIKKVSNLIMKVGSDPQKNIARIVDLTLRAGIEEMRKMFSTMSLKDMLNFFPLDKDDPEKVVKSVYENIYNGDLSMFPGGQQRINDLLGKSERIVRVRNIFNK